MPSANAIPIVGAVVAAMIGVLLGYWLRRSKPWAGIVSITRNDTDLVVVPIEFTAVYARRSAGEVQIQRLPLRRLVKINEDSKTNSDGAKRALELFREARGKLENDACDQETKRKALRSLLGDDAIFGNISYLCRGGQFALPADVEAAGDTTSLIQAEDCTADESNDKAYVFYVDHGRAVLRPGDGPVGQQQLARIRTFGQVIQHLVQPHFSQLLDAVEREISEDLQRYVELRDRSSELIKGRNLIVRVQVTNTGGSSEHFSAHALLQLRGGGRSLSPVIATIRSSRLHEPGYEDVQHMVGVIDGIAAKQGVEAPTERSGARSTPQFVVVKPGDTIEIDLHTSGLSQQESAITALEQGMLGARVILERLTKKRFKWLKTDWTVLGETISEDKKNELDALAKKLN
ncbi:MAG: hypothetical protein ABIK83_15020 [Candidatus Zixiibacteriota bacterium]